MPGAETSSLQGRESVADALGETVVGSTLGGNEAQVEPISPLASELNFYQHYGWSLNPFLTVAETYSRLADELGRVAAVREAWQQREVMTNVFLFSCALLNSIDDYISGPTYRLPRSVLSLPFSKALLGVAERITALLRRRRISLTERWKAHWQPEFERYLQQFLSEGDASQEAIKQSAQILAALLRLRLPHDLRAQIVRLPSAFREQGLTHFDVMSLGRKFVDHFPDRQQPILIAGLRTAGSYFAPLLCASLKITGYQHVNVMTMRPKRGLAARERAELMHYANAQHIMVLLDEPPDSGWTLAAALQQVREADCLPEKLVILVPVRTTRRDWETRFASTPLNITILSLQPAEWHKQHLLAPEMVEQRLRAYFLRGKCRSLTIAASPAEYEFNARLQLSSTERTRFKRVYDVRLETEDALTQTRYVLAKSVGWGWLGYSAFLAGARLTGLVPSVLGLREGVIYIEWLPQPAAISFHRSQFIERAAKYVAARTLHLRLGSDPMPALGLDSQNVCLDLAQKILCKVYGPWIARLMRSRVRRRLSQWPCPVPTLIDGKMSSCEWVLGHSGPLKTDFEHHGFGKYEVNIHDPAYDLADIVLSFGLSPSEEQQLIGGYTDRTDDTDLKIRLFTSKLIAGIRSMDSALRLLNQTGSSDKASGLNKQYLCAWNFLTLECARFCGNLCSRPESPRWFSPLVVLDIDGVLDRRYFGFPTTTAAGIRALRLLHAHGFAIAANTGRSASEVEAYCAAYGLAGGVAEYGSYIFDAVSDRGLKLVSARALEQLEELRQALRQIPGVFLNDGYENSIRAFTYDRQGTVPLPNLMISTLMASLNLDGLRSFQTTIDTTIVSNDVDKGTGLRALLEFAAQDNLEIIAVGDSEPDLAMFRVAGKNFAPLHVDRSIFDRVHGCRIADRPYQLGLLAIAKSVIHPDGKSCRKCASGNFAVGNNDELFLDLLHAADKTKSMLLLRALLSVHAFGIFLHS